MADNNLKKTSALERQWYVNRVCWPVNSYAIECNKAWELSQHFAEIRFFVSALTYLREPKHPLWCPFLNKNQLLFNEYQS